MAAVARDKHVRTDHNPRHLAIDAERRTTYGGKPLDDFESFHGRLQRRLPSPERHPDGTAGRFAAEVKRMIPRLGARRRVGAALVWGKSSPCRRAYLGPALRSKLAGESIVEDLRLLHPGRTAVVGRCRSCIGARPVQLSLSRRSRYLGYAPVAIDGVMVAGRR